MTAEHPVSFVFETVVTVRRVKELAHTLLGREPETALGALALLIASNDDGHGFLGDHTIAFAELALQCEGTWNVRFERYLSAAHALKFALEERDRVVYSLTAFEPRKIKAKHRR